MEEVEGLTVTGIIYNLERSYVAMMHIAIIIVLIV